MNKLVEQYLKGSNCLRKASGRISLADMRYAKRQ